MATVGTGFEGVKTSPYRYAGDWGGFGEGTYASKKHELRRKLFPKIKESIKNLKGMKEQAFGGLGIDSPTEQYKPEITGSLAEQKQRAGIEMGGYSPIFGHRYKSPKYLGNTYLGRSRVPFKVGSEAHHVNIAGRYHKYANPGVKVKIFARSRPKDRTRFKGKAAQATSLHKPSKSSLDTTKEFIGSRETGAKQEFGEESFRKNPEMGKLFKSTAKRVKKREKVARGILGDI